MRILALLLLLSAAFSAKADDYDNLRTKHLTTLTGGTGINLQDPNIKLRVDAIDARANQVWTSLNKSSARLYLFAPYQTGTNGFHVQGSYEQLKTMALAYATTGAQLQGNPNLRADILSGMDWLYANWYNETTGQPGNWFEWELAIPFALNDLLVLMYADLGAARLANNINAIDQRSPDPTKLGGLNGSESTGANRAWKCRVVLIRGIVGKNSTKITAARDALGREFNYVTSGDGFYTDGSFIQHGKHPYAGGYGTGSFSSITELLNLLAGSAWPVTDPNVTNIYKWVFDTFEPLVYKGGVMAMTQGREIARPDATEHRIGHSIITTTMLLANAAPTVSIGSKYPANPALAMKRMVKYWTAVDTNRVYSPSSLYTYIRYQALLADASVTARGERLGHYRFASSDRVVHLRPGFGFGISMHSSRIYNYESINNENLKGWHTSDGMTYLYNNHLGQFSGNFWPTVNAYRLPGTTVAQNTPVAQEVLSDQNWVGGTNVAAGYGVTGMSLHVGNLRAKKSWFMFDDEVVALGAGIATTDNKVVETIVENRRLVGKGTNALVVNGVAQSTAADWSATLNAVKWAHLAGTGPGTDIGYYFPTAVPVRASRETKNNTWNEINKNSGISGGTNTYTNRFLALWLDHGTMPSAGTYSYVLLPNKTTAQVGAYATSPHIQVLKNTPEVQAVKENELGIIGANFWTNTFQAVDVSANYPAFITCNKKAAVMVDEDAGTIEIAVSDPTQQNTGTIEVEVKKSASGLVSKSSEITVLQSSPTIKLQVNVNGTRGKTLTAKFSIGTTNNRGVLSSSEPVALGDPAVAGVFPNPAKAHFTLPYLSNRNQEAKLQLVDGRGRVVKEWPTVTLVKGMNHVEVNVPQGAHGLHTVHLLSTEGRVAHKVILLP